jgi:hypothetical protein
MTVFLIAAIVLVGAAHAGTAEAVTDPAEAAPVEAAPEETGEFPPPLPVLPELPPDTELWGEDAEVEEDVLDDEAVITPDEPVSEHDAAMELES